MMKKNNKDDYDCKLDHYYKTIPKNILKLFER